MKTNLVNERSLYYRHRIKWNPFSHDYSIAQPSGFVQHITKCYVTRKLRLTKRRCGTTEEKRNATLNVTILQLSFAYKLIL